MYFFTGEKMGSSGQGNSKEKLSILIIFNQVDVLKHID